MDKFPSTTTLWQILRKFEAGVAGGAKPRNFTGRGVPKTSDSSGGSGRLYYETPVLHVLGREYSTLEELQKSLSNIGVASGSILLKLRFEVTDQPFEEAAKRIDTFFKSDEDKTSAGAPLEAAPVQPSTQSQSAVAEQAGNPVPVAPSEGHDHTASTPDTVSESVQQSAEGANVTPTSLTAQVIPGISARPIAVYAPPSTTTPQAAQKSYNPADYTPTVDHAKLHQARLNESSRNKRLLSDSEIAAQEVAQAEKLSKVQEVEIKVRFPDQSSVITKFMRDDTAETLYAQVRSLLARDNEPFILSVAGVKGNKILPRGKEKLIHDLKLWGKVLVVVTWDEGASNEARTGKSLKEAVADKAQEIVVKEVDTIEADEPVYTPQPKKEDTAKEKGKGGGLNKFLKHLSKK